MLEATKPRVRNVAGESGAAMRLGVAAAARWLAALAIAAVAGPALAAVGVNKSFAPNSVTAGQVSTLTIVLLNPNAAPATGVAVTDTLPTNVVVANPLTIGTNTCGFAVTATPGTSPIALTGGTIGGITGGAAGQCQITINVVSSLPNTYLNSIPAGAVTSSQGTNAQAAQATLVVSAPANITGSKSFSPANLHGNGVTQTSASTLTITLANPNPVPLTNAAITDALPAALTIATPANAATTCSGGTATASSPATNPATIALSGGTIPAGGSCTLSVNVVARSPTAAQNGNVTNTVPVGALTTTEGATSPAFSGNVLVQTGAAVSKTFSPNPIPSGGTASTMTITLTNFNQTTLAPIDFTDSWTGTMTATGASTTCGGTVAFTATSVTLTGGALGPAPAASGGTSCTITVPVTATATTVNSVPAGTIGGVNYAAATGTLTVSTITGSKSFSTPALQGGATTMTITLTNRSASAATITSVTDNLLTTMGAGFSVPVGASVGGTCGTSLTSALPATTLTFAGGTIPANGSCTIIVNAVAIASNAPTGNRTNTIAAGGVVTSQGNNTTTLTGTVNVTRVLSATKAFAPANVQAGARSRLTVTLSRPAGAPALASLAFTDSLTTMGGLGFVVANPANAATTCTGGTVAAAPGANSFSLSGGGLAGGAAATSCTVSVDVQVPVAQAPGTFTNTLAAGAVTSAGGFTNAAATANLVVSASTFVTINKSFSPTTVAVGGTSTMSIQIRNNNVGAIALTGVGLVDNLPPGMVIANPPAPAFTGAGCSGATITAVNNAATVTLAGASVNANSICSLVVGVRANVSGNLINSIFPGTVTSAQGVTNPLLGSATLAATGIVNLNMTKTNGVAFLTPGGTTVYTIGVTNSGPNDVAGVTVTDNPPAGVTFGAWTCVATGGATCGSGSGPISDTVTIPNGGSITYTVPAAIAPGAVGSITNTVTLGVPGSVINTGNTTASDTDPLIPTTALAVTKDDGSPTYQPGLGATYVIVVTNAGPSDVTNGVLTDTFPAGVTQNGAVTCIAVGTGASCGTIGNLGSGFSVAGAYVPATPGSTLTYTVPVSFSAGLTAPSITNTVTVTNPPNTGPGSSASASDTNTLLLLAPTVAKAILPATIAAGGAATLSITLGNANAITIALSQAFTDPMPAGVTITGAATTTCANVTSTATTITMASGSALQAGGCTISVPITSSTPGTVTNITSSLVTSAGTGAPAQAPLTVTAVGPTLGKTILPGTITAGGTATLTITLGNPNALPLALTAAFTDAMPSGVTTTSGNTGTCAGVTVTPTTITMASGASIPAGGCTIVVAITSSTPGTVTNQTSALQTNVGTAPIASAPLTVTAAIATLGKSIAPNPITAGGTSTLTLTLGNPNATPLALTADLTDPMPAGVTTTSGNTGTCAGVTVAPALVTMASGSSIPAGGCTIVVAITSTTPGTVTNTTGTLTTSAGATTPASAPLTVTAAAATLGKTILPATIVSGGASTLTLTLGNPNATPQALTAAFSDPMPAGVTTSSGNTGTCTGVTVTSTTITMASGATIPAGGCTIIVAITSSTPGTVTNMTGTLQTAGGTAPAASAPLTVTATGSAIGKTILPATIAAGGTSTLTITLANVNATPLALTAAFSDPMPAGVTTTSGSTGTCMGVTVTATTITMASGATIPAGGCTIVVAITSSTPGTVTNTTGPLQTSGGTAPPASAPITVTAVVDLTIAKRNTGPFTLGQVGAQYEIVVSNLGTAPTSGPVTLTDTLPAGLTPTSIGGAGWTCAQPSGPCTRSDPLAPGASHPAVTLTVNVATNAPSPVVNLVAVQGGGDTNGANNSASSVVNLGPPPVVTPIPVNAPAMLVLLSALLALLGGWRSRP